MLKIILSMFCLITVACNVSFLKDVPILYYMENNYLYVLNSENRLTKYDIDADCVTLVKQIDTTIKTPLHFITIDSNNFVLFSGGGTDYTIINQENETNFTNNNFSHLSEVLKYGNKYVLNTVSGIFICDEKMKITGKIPCVKDSPCSPEMKILSNNFVVLKDYDNLKDISKLRVFDTLYNLINETEIDGFVSGSSELNIVENEDKALLTFCISNGENIFIGNWNYKTSLIKTQNIGKNNFTPLKIDRQFIYLSYESDLVTLNKYNGEQEWTFKYNAPLDDIEISDKYVVVNHKNGVDVLNRKQGKKIKTVVSSTYRKSFLYKSYLIVVEDKGEIKKYNLN